MNTSFFLLAIVAYILAGSAFASLFWKQLKSLRVVGWATFVVGFLAHAADISARAFENLHPGSSIHEALGFISFVIGLAFATLASRYKIASLGAFVVPVIVVLLALARLSPDTLNSEPYSALMRVHIALASVGVAIFAVATAVAIAYLLENRTLKQKSFDGFWFKRGISLQVLDKLGHRLAVMGFLIFTIAVMLGAITVADSQGTWKRPEYPFAMITWLTFGSVVVGRTTHGWRGRQSCFAVILGFCAACVVLGIYLARRLM